MEYSTRGHDKIVQLLLTARGQTSDKSSIDINKESINGDTALILALWRGHDKVVELLLIQGNRR
jgi:ankyrin repeat protein